MQHLQFCFESKIDRHDRYRIGSASCPKCFRNSKSCCDWFRPPVHWKQSRRVPAILVRTATARPSERTSDFMQPDSGQLQALLDAWNLKDLRAQNDGRLGSKNSKQAQCHALITVSSCHAYGCTSPWAMTNSVEKAFGPTANDWISHFAPCRVIFLCSCWARPRCNRDAESLVHKGSAQAKVAWGCSNLENSSTVWSWEIHVFTSLYPSVESSPQMKKTQRRWRESFQSQWQIDERSWHRITDWLRLETMVWMPGISWKIYWSLSRQVTGGKPMGTKTCIPTSQRPIIASKFYQKATAASLLAQPSIDPQTKTGFWKKQGATAASCQLHIGLRQLSSNGNVCSTRLHWCLAATFAPQAPTPRTLPFFCHNTTETGNSLNSRQ